ncbi:hypothetical protein [Zoogloea sp.]|uniref:hypothetical protein n=1 Tax=Zoogloea sp. TaxID=49181 RepID=UPI0014160649|nr:MAG: hypothetical protein F9K15_12870 [Zoogloea sp.]
MDPKINRKLHALASGIAPGEAHEFLKETARERFGAEYRTLSMQQCSELSRHLREVKERLRTGIYQALHGAEGSPISEQQISQAKQYQKLLGWSDHYLWKMINDRYGETSLEAMPKWKAVRLVAYLQKRWHTKHKRTNQESTVS